MTLKPIPAMIPRKEEPVITEEQMNLAVQEAQRLKIQNEHRISSLALMEGALRFRQGHYLEDIETFEANAIAKMESTPEYQRANSAKRKKLEAATRAVILEYKQKTENVNKVLEAEVKTLSSAFTEKSHDKFDHYVATFCEVATELRKARNTADFLKVCILYNMGLFEKALGEIKKVEQSEKPNDNEANKPSETIDELIARHNNAGLQEGHHLSIVTDEPTKNGASDNEQHDSAPPSWPVQDDSVERTGRDGPGSDPDPELP